MTTDTKTSLAQAEEDLLDTWDKEHTFEESVQQRKRAQLFSFYDGPPFANGKPHYGHLATSVLKDAIPRYKTMQGYYVPRRFGWDCHGLPAEMLAEKELNVSGKKAIIAYGIDNFNNYCRESVVRFTEDWHNYVRRLGRWVDFKDDYHTMDQDYMESVMWAFKEMYKKGLIYEGERVVPYSYGAQTALSNFETRADDSYRDREDITVTVKFKLGDGRFLLAWTTTPWCLPSQLLLAVGSEIDYVEVDNDGEHLILAEDALERFPELDDAEVVRRIKGNKLVGMTYEPVFDYFKDTPGAFRVVAADFVKTDEGVGVVTISPGHGEDDFWLGKREGLPVISPVDDNGCYTAQVPDYAFRLVFDASNEIVADLDKQKKLFKSSLYTHKYPHCWRTDVPIIYRAMSAWFLDVPKIKQDLLGANQNINWIPANVKDGAVGKWLEGAREWNISRKRFWGAPIPVWKTEDGELLVPGSLKELREMAVDPSKVVDLHRPYIDDVVLKTKDGRLAHRVEDVLDCWFESGSMPFAQMHYPFENKKQFEETFPADFITEYIGQTRGWFYTLLVVQAALFGQEAFKNCLAHGILLGNDGRKLSKRLRNYPDITVATDKYGIDSLRVYMLGMSVMSGDSSAFDEKALVETQRNIIQRFSNINSFFRMYADVDGWKPGKKIEIPVSDNILDQWMLARLQLATHEVTTAADAYETPKVIRALAELLDDTSNWFVRRSRRRFWKSEDDADKQQAYATLHYVLLRICQLLAPWAPFISDRMWRELSTTMDEPKSVHLSDWPKTEAYDTIVLADMAAVREVITVGLAKRAEAKIKVRQPLAGVTVPDFPTAYEPIIAEELNVKQVTFKGAEVVMDTHLTDELRAEGAMRDLVRHVQNLRKTAGLQVDDRIVLQVATTNPLAQKAVKLFGAALMQETLAIELSDSQLAYATSVKIEGDEVALSLDKV